MVELKSLLDSHLVDLHVSGVLKVAVYITNRAGSILSTGSSANRRARIL